MHVRTLPLISQPNLMPHGSGYISTLSVMLLPRGSALGLAHGISLGEQVAHGFHKNLCISRYGASINCGYTTLTTVMYHDFLSVNRGRPCR
jgi:hypothetical protein